MAKAVPLTLDAMSVQQITPQAATPARTPAGSEPGTPAAPPPVHVPLQIRIPKNEARAIKIAAAEREQTISDFMLACFHACTKA